VTVREVWWLVDDGRCACPYGWDIGMADELVLSSKHAGNVSWWGRNVQSIFISTQLQVLQLQLLSF
jgi:hypothetical protein